jgi:hypothetical protein
MNAKLAFKEQHRAQRIAAREALGPRVAGLESYDEKMARLLGIHNEIATKLSDLRKKIE